MSCMYIFRYVLALDATGESQLLSILADEVRVVVDRSLVNDTSMLMDKSWGNHLFEVTMVYEVS